MEKEKVPRGLSIFSKGLDLQSGGGRILDMGSEGAGWEAGARHACGASAPRYRAGAGSLASGGPSGPRRQISNLESCFRSPHHVNVHGASQSCATGRPWDRRKTGGHPLNVEPPSLAPLLLWSSKISCDFSAPFILES